MLAMTMTVGSVIVNSVVSPAEVWDEYYIALHGAYNALRVAFAESGMTQEELAAKLGLDKALVSRRLTGSENLTVRTLSHMGTGMGYSLVIGFHQYDFSGMTNQYTPTPVHWNKPTMGSGIGGVIDVNTSDNIHNMRTGSIRLQQVG
jgi:hypothetical protein